MDNMENRIAELEQTVAELKNIINGYKIDKQYLIRSEGTIKPGAATKVVYDSNGLIKQGTKLDPSDIPTIPVSKVDGLQETLTKAPTRDQLHTLDQKVDNMMKRGRITQTGCKVNVDDKGLVVGVYDLAAEDIPKLPIEHINGLNDIIHQLKEANQQQEQDEFLTSAGTGTKVTYDNKGRVLHSEPLSLEDVPPALVTKVNEIIEALSQFALASELKEVQHALIGESISATPGTYVKVNVAPNGKVVDGKEILSADDIPTLPISHISGLTEAISNSVSRSEFIELQNTIAQLMSQKSQPVKLSSAPDPEVYKLRADMEELANRVNRINDDDSFKKELDSIRQDISTLSARITMIEKKA